MQTVTTHSSLQYALSSTWTNNNQTWQVFELTCRWRSSSLSRSRSLSRSLSFSLMSLARCSTSLRALSITSFLFFHNLEPSNGTKRTSLRAQELLLPRSRTLWNLDTWHSDAVHQQPPVVGLSIIVIVLYLKVGDKTQKETQTKEILMPSRLPCWLASVDGNVYRLRFRRWTSQHQWWTFTLFPVF